MMVLIRDPDPATLYLRPYNPIHDLRPYNPIHDPTTLR